MDVAIDNHGAMNFSVMLHLANGDGDVVDGAETFAVIRKGMVKSTAYVEADTFVESQAGRQGGAACRQPECARHFRRIRNLELQNLFLAQGSVLEALDPSALMHQQQIIVRSRLG